jgi:E-phenylitaconyl-CoA hydratase
MNIRVDRWGNVLVLTLEGDSDLSIGVIDDALFGALDAYEADGDLRCCVVTAAGTRAFSAGADLRALGGIGAGAGGQRRATLLNGAELAKPLIAAVNGHCVGAGFMFAAACDIRIAADHATFAVPEVRYGFPPGMGVTQRLPRLMPLGPVMEFLLTGDRITAQQALQWGFVNRVVPGAELVDTAVAVAARIAANPPLAVRGTKELLRRNPGMSQAAGMRLAEALFEAGLRTEDAREALQAFREKRPPVFKGR